MDVGRKLVGQNLVIGTRHTSVFEALSEGHMVAKRWRMYGRSSKCDAGRLSICKSPDIFKTVLQTDDNSD
ncbi:hypothetical protein EGR_10077 [Echinococcus granulosus]|uniref:Uncharacterized protein n=1 Tax=Echinococcus granulosus TaxID=6210 RepID=W6U3D2_ECHGR|nr:hypothetical protein EGR_10077 [Echinococcus granulosus]EUB55056.1 hypothetical protein EGR_10077 [Echinococcus granulosus]